ncbi:MAG: hypothetical protein EOO77_15985 [Oxalobacteraceae bacterium]|nr:MAG: hypothetical protein EOO77_15985 [Oxalobacteraceae bacterium]
MNDKFYDLRSSRAAETSALEVTRSIWPVLARADITDVVADGDTWQLPVAETQNATFTTPRVHPKTRR